MVATTSARLEGFWFFQPSASKLVEPGFTNPKLTGSQRGVQKPRVEIRKDLKDETSGQAMNDLFLFKAGISLGRGNQREQKEPASTKLEGGAAVAMQPPLGLRYAPASRRLHCNGNQRETVPQTGNSTFAPSPFTFAPFQFTFAPAPTVLFYIGRAGRTA